MNTDYRYQLETPKLTGRRQQKTTCPSCGKKKCFVRYVDTQNGFRYVADEVGKCDHQHSCGYHYKPSEYFRDNPLALPPKTNCQLSIVNCQFAKPFSALSPDLVDRSHRQGLVHGGHIMQYRPDGHRGGYQGWTHGPLIQQRLLPPDWQLYQCLYGEHLLPLRPDAHVCIVESEKTALIMAALQPQHLWLATSGSGGLNAEKLACLRGRCFTLFPDSGCFEKWQKVMQGVDGFQYTISDRLEQYPANTDLADLLLEPP